MNILITGGLGHIGSYFIKRLSDFKVNITVVDNLLTQRYSSLFHSDINKFLDVDIDDLTEEHLNGIDIVIHLAAITNAEKSFQNKETY